MSVTNREVCEAWSSGQAASNHRGSLVTDGKRLFSYRLQIGDTGQRGSMKVLRDYTARGKWGFQSQTTSCHVGLAAQFADLVD